MSDYEQLAQKPLGDNILAQIAQTARDIVAATDEVAEAEEALKAKQASLKALKEEILPELMSIAGQEQLTTIDGYKVTLKDMVRGQPSKENEAKAYAWLREHGQGGVIKSRLEADLGKGDPELVKQAIEALSAIGVRAAAKQSIPWQTLGALVRELLEAGKPVPLDLLGVHMWKQADVKAKG